ncbi:hypothetical protein EPN18_06830 [bacterium]|nr:MAG: hypothetical protein EPN18_06830 [bacterium]
MWLKEDLRQASFRKIEFDFIDIEDGFKKSLARYEYPYTDGSDLEDMGLAGRTVKLKAVFLPERYAGLSSFVAALQSQGAGDVVHPVFGAFRAVPETISIKHDERAYFAEVDITFVEHTTLQISVPAFNAEAEAIEAGDEVAVTLDGVDNALGKTLPEDIDAASLGDSGFMDAISGLTAKIRAVMSGINSAVATVKAFISKTTAPFKLITSAVTFATSLPGAILGSFAAGIESVAGAYASLLSAPGKFTDSVNFGLSKIEKALGDFGGDKTIKAAWHCSKSSALTSAAALELSLDEAVEAGRTVSLKAYGLENTATRTRLMTIDEIDAVSAAARESINTAIASVREAFNLSSALEESLKRQAIIIQKQADKTRLKREKIIDYQVPSDMPLHLLAFNLYGGIEKADRLLFINKIRNPNFLKAGEVIRIYA